MDSAAFVEASLSRRCILVVEDDGIQLALLAELLDAAGYLPIPCASAQLALDWLHQNEAPHLLLLDVRMPQMDGWTFLQETRYIPRVRQVPVVVLSADHDMERMAKLMDVTCFLPKPYHLPMLLDVLEEALAAGAQRSGSDDGTSGGS